MAKSVKKPSYNTLVQDLRMSHAAFQIVIKERDKYKAALELLGATLRPFVCPELDRDNG